MADILVQSRGGDELTLGADIVTPGKTRASYIECILKADASDFASLLTFAPSQPARANNSSPRHELTLLAPVRHQVTRRLSAKNMQPVSTTRSWPSDRSNQVIYDPVEETSLLCGFN